MPQTASPFGLKIVKVQGGPIVQSTERIILVANANGNGLVLPQSTGIPSAPTIGNIYAGDPIWYDGAGSIQNSLSNVVGNVGTLAYNSPNTNPILGTFQGVEYSDSSGKRTVSNKWTNPGLFPGSEVWFWHTAASTADWIFEIQTNAIIFQDSIGATFGVVGVGTPNAVTGFSTVALSVATAAGGLQLYGLAYDPVLATTGANNGYAPGTPTAGNNNWGDPFVNVYVKLAKGQFTANTATF